EIDLARVGRRARRQRIYLLRDAGQLSRVILPIHGYGLWSTMHGFVAVRPDGNTVADITFYDHGETPGLGDFVTKPAWQRAWRGKRLFDPSGALQIEVVPRRVPAGDPLADHHVDGVSGATLTARGVTNTLRYWMGEHGYGPYLRSLQEERP